MGDALRLYFRYLGVSSRQMQCRASFIMVSLGHMSSPASVSRAGGALLPLAPRLDPPRWRCSTALVNMTFAIADAVAQPGVCWQLLKAAFDRLLLRPRTPASSSQGEIVLRPSAASPRVGGVPWAASARALYLDSARLAFVASAIAGGVCIFVGFFILQATLSFWTIETIELGNILTHGGVETAQYPLTIYRPWFRTFFTTVAPLAFISYFPGLVLLGRSAQSGLPAPLLWCSPLVGLAFLTLCLRLWRFGERTTSPQAVAAIHHRDTENTENDRGNGNGGGTSRPRCLSLSVLWVSVVNGRSAATSRSPPLPARRSRSTGTCSASPASCVPSPPPPVARPFAG
jgi:ABC-2 type transport system permease protein